MIKKTCLLILALVLLTVMLTACRDNSSAESTPPPDPNDSATQANTPEPTSQSDTDNPMRGVWSNNVYSNPYLGFNLTIPDSWVVATDAEIAERMGVGEDFFKSLDSNNLDDSVWDVLGETTIHDTMVQSKFTGANIQIIFERLSFPHNRITATEYIHIAAPLLESMGFTIDLSKADTSVKFGNSD